MSLRSFAFLLLFFAQQLAAQTLTQSWTTNNVAASDGFQVLTTRFQASLLDTLPANLTFDFPGEADAFYYLTSFQVGSTSYGILPSGTPGSNQVVCAQNQSSLSMTIAGNTQLPGSQYLTLTFLASNLTTAGAVNSSLSAAGWTVTTSALTVIAADLYDFDLSPAWVSNLEFEQEEVYTVNNYRDEWDNSITSTQVTLAATAAPTGIVTLSPQNSSPNDFLTVSAINTLGSSIISISAQKGTGTPVVKLRDVVVSSDQVVSTLQVKTRPDSAIGADLPQGSYRAGQVPPLFVVAYDSANNLIPVDPAWTYTLSGADATHFDCVGGVLEFEDYSGSEGSQDVTIGINGSGVTASLNFTLEEGYPASLVLGTAWNTNLEYGDVASYSVSSYRDAWNNDIPDAEIQLEVTVDDADLVSINTVQGGTDSFTLTAQDVSGAGLVTITAREISSSVEYSIQRNISISSDLVPAYLAIKTSPDAAYLDVASDPASSYRAGLFPDLFVVAYDVNQDLIPVQSGWTYNRSGTSASRYTCESGVLHFVDYMNSAGVQPVTVQIAGYAPSDAISPTINYGYLSQVGFVEDWESSLVYEQYQPYTISYYRDAWNNDIIDTAVSLVASSTPTGIVNISVPTSAANPDTFSVRAGSIAAGVSVGLSFQVSGDSNVLNDVRTLVVGSDDIPTAIEVKTRPDAARGQYDPAASYRAGQVPDLFVVAYDAEDNIIPVQAGWNYSLFGASAGHFSLVGGHLVFTDYSGSAGTQSLEININEFFTSDPLAFNVNVTPGLLSQVVLDEVWQSELQYQQVAGYGIEAYLDAWDNDIADTQVSLVLTDPASLATLTSTVSADNPAQDSLSVQAGNTAGSTSVLMTVQYALDPAFVVSRDLRVVSNDLPSQIAIKLRSDALFEDSGQNPLGSYRVGDLPDLYLVSYDAEGSVITPSSDWVYPDPASHFSVDSLGRLFQTSYLASSLLLNFDVQGSGFDVDPIPLSLELLADPPSEFNNDSWLLQDGFDLEANAFHLTASHMAAALDLSLNGLVDEYGNTALEGDSLSVRAMLEGGVEKSLWINVGPGGQAELSNFYLNTIEGIHLPGSHLLQIRSDNGNVLVSQPILASPFVASVDDIATGVYLQTGSHCQEIPLHIGNGAPVDLHVLRIEHAGNIAWLADGNGLTVPGGQSLTSMIQLEIDEIWAADEEFVLYYEIASQEYDYSITIQTDIVEFGLVTQFYNDYRFNLNGVLDQEFTLDRPQDLYMLVQRLPQDWGEYDIELIDLNIDNVTYPVSNASIPDTADSLVSTIDDIVFNSNSRETRSGSLNVLLDSTVPLQLDFEMTDLALSEPASVEILLSARYYANTSNSLLIADFQKGTVSMSDVHLFGAAISQTELASFNLAYEDTLDFALSLDPAVDEVIPATGTLELELPFEPGFQTANTAGRFFVNPVLEPDFELLDVNGAPVAVDFAENCYLDVSAFSVSHIDLIDDGVFARVPYGGTESVTYSTLIAGSVIDSLFYNLSIRPAEFADFDSIKMNGVSLQFYDQNDVQLGLPWHSLIDTLVFENPAIDPAGNLRRASFTTSSGLLRLPTDLVVDSRVELSANLTAFDDSVAIPGDYLCSLELPRVESGVLSIVQALSSMEHIVGGAPTYTATFEHATIGSGSASTVEIDYSRVSGEFMVGATSIELEESPDPAVSGGSESWDSSLNWDQISGAVDGAGLYTFKLDLPMGCATVTPTTGTDSTPQSCWIAPGSFQVGTLTLFDTLDVFIDWDLLNDDGSQISENVVSGAEYLLRCRLDWQGDEPIRGTDNTLRIDFATIDMLELSSGAETQSLNAKPEVLDWIVQVGASTQRLQSRELQHEDIVNALTINLTREYTGTLQEFELDGPDDTYLLVYQETEFEPAVLFSWLVDSAEEQIGDVAPPYMFAYDDASIPVGFRIDNNDTSSSLSISGLLFAYRYSGDSNWTAIESYPAFQVAAGGSWEASVANQVQNLDHDGRLLYLWIRYDEISYTGTGHYVNQELIVVPDPLELQLYDVRSCDLTLSLYDAESGDRLENQFVKGRELDLKIEYVHSGNYPASTQLTIDMSDLNTVFDWSDTDPAFELDRENGQESLRLSVLSNPANLTMTRLLGAMDLELAPDPEVVLPAGNVTWYNSSQTILEAVAQADLPAFSVDPEITGLAPGQAYSGQVLFELSQVDPDQELILTVSSDSELVVFTQSVVQTLEISEDLEATGTLSFNLLETTGPQPESVQIDLELRLPEVITGLGVTKLANLTFPVLLAPQVNLSWDWTQVRSIAGGQVLTGFQDAVLTRGHPFRVTLDAEWLNQASLIEGTSAQIGHTLSSGPYELADQTITVAAGAGSYTLDFVVNQTYAGPWPAEQILEFNLDSAPEWQVGDAAGQVLTTLPVLQFFTVQDYPAYELELHCSVNQRDEVTLNPDVTTSGVALWASELSGSTMSALLSLDHNAGSAQAIGDMTLSWGRPESPSTRVFSIANADGQQKQEAISSSSGEWFLSLVLGSMVDENTGLAINPANLIEGWPSQGLRYFIQTNPVHQQWIEMRQRGDAGSLDLAYIDVHFSGLLNYGQSGSNAADLFNWLPIEAVDYTLAGLSWNVRAEDQSILRINVPAGHPLRLSESDEGMLFLPGLIALAESRTVSLQSTSSQYVYSVPPYQLEHRYANDPPPARRSLLVDTVPPQIDWLELGSSGTIRTTRPRMFMRLMDDNSGLDLDSLEISLRGLVLDGNTSAVNDWQEIPLFLASGSFEERTSSSFTQALLYPEVTDSEGPNLQIILGSSDRFQASGGAGIKVHAVDLATQANAVDLTRDLALYAAGEARLIAGPNPWDPNRYGDLIVQYRFPSTASDAELLVLDLAGDLVRRIPLGRVLDGTVTWDGLNSRGQAVANGAYLLVLDGYRNGNQERKLFKLAVLRGEL